MHVYVAVVSTDLARFARHNIWNCRRERAGRGSARERVAFSFVQSPIVRKFGFDAGRRVDLGRRTRRIVVDHLARWILYGREKISRRVCEDACL